MKNASSFVFVISDFVVEPDEELWLRAVDRRWDVVPVIVQDPTWERSFPDVSGVAVPVVEPQTQRVTFLRLTRREAHEQRRRNEERVARLTSFFNGLDFDPVLVTSEDPIGILEAFSEWAERRLYWRGRA